MADEKTNIATVVTTEDALALVEKGEGKFLSYGHDIKFFFLYKGGTYANREKEGYTLLGGIKNDSGNTVGDKKTYS